MRGALPATGVRASGIGGANRAQSRAGKPKAGELADRPSYCIQRQTDLAGVRYATSAGALVLYKHADDSMRITIEGHLGILREALERLSSGYSDGGYVMTKSTWARLVSQFGQQFGTITNNYLSRRKKNDAYRGQVANEAATSELATLRAEARHAASAAEGRAQ